jgi:hypothetical protein
VRADRGGVRTGGAEDLQQQLARPVDDLGLGGALATKPSTLTMRTTDDSSPTTPRSAASAFSAQMRAAAFACSGVTDAPAPVPTLPTATSSPSIVGS